MNHQSNGSKNCNCFCHKQRLFWSSNFHKNRKQLRSCYCGDDEKVNSDGICFVVVVVRLNNLWHQTFVQLKVKRPNQLVELWEIMLFALFFASNFPKFAMQRFFSAKINFEWHEKIMHCFNKNTVTIWCHPFFKCNGLS